MSRDHRVNSYLWGYLLVLLGSSLVMGRVGLALPFPMYVGISTAIAGVFLAGRAWLP